MKKNLIIGSFLLAASVGANADYQLEANAGLGFGDDDQKTAGASLSIYFEEVDVSKGPLREAAFLNKSSSVTISGFSDTPNRNGFETFDASALARFVVKNDVIFEVGGGSQGDDNFVTLGLGAYMSDNVDVVVNYTRDTSSGSEDYVANFHGYMPIPGDQSFAFGVKFGSASLGGEKGTVIGADVTYYPINNFGFTLGGDEESYDSLDVTTLFAKAEYFINESYAVSATYNYTEVDDEDSDLVSINATARF